MSGDVEDAGFAVLMASVLEAEEGRPMLDEYWWIKGSRDK